MTHHPEPPRPGPPAAAPSAEAANAPRHATAHDPARDTPAVGAGDGDNPRVSAARTGEATTAPSTHQDCATPVDTAPNRSRAAGAARISPARGGGTHPVPLEHPDRATSNTGPAASEAADVPRVNAARSSGAITAPSTHPEHVTPYSVPGSPPASPSRGSGTPPGADPFGPVTVRRPAAGVLRRPRWRGPGAGALVAADGAAALIGLCEVGPDGGPVLPVVLLGVLVTVYGRAGLYRPALAPTALDDVPAVALGAIVAWGMAAAALAATARRDALGWAELAGAVALTAAAAVAGRALAYRLRLRRSRRDPAPTLVVGAAPAAQQVAATLRAHPEYGLRPVGVAGPARGVVARQAAPGHDALPALPLLTGRADITRAVVRNSVRHAVVVGPPAPGDTLVGLLTARGCQVWQVRGAAARPAHLWGHAYAPVAGGPDLRRHVKRAMDVVLASAALLAVAPVLGGCALAVRLADGPGVLFRQERIGLDGLPFTLLKFRTLRPGTAHESSTRWTVAGDPRMSAVGRLLRRTSLDELPQLWNVLRGDMSMVGPRPERPHFVEQFSTTHPGYADRHRMPAGITGLAQVHGLRGDTSIADRARFDNHYIDTWSLWQDVAIMLRTAGYLFRLGGS